MSHPSDRKAKAQAVAPKGERRANVIIVAGLVAVFALAAIVGGVIWASTRDSGGTSAGGAPTGTSMGQPYNPYPDATLVANAPTVDVYEDFRCPVCKTFEQAFGSTISDLAEEGKIKLQVHLKTVIDANFGGDNSAVAGSAALCAADQGAWRKTHDALFAAQPQEPQTFTAATLEEAGSSAGLSGQALSDYTSCVKDKKYVDYVRSVDDASAKAGFTGTPALVLNGTRVQWGAFADADSQPDPQALATVLESGEVPADKVAKE